MHSGEKDGRDKARIKEEKEERQEIKRGRKEGRGEGRRRGRHTLEKLARTSYILVSSELEALGRFNILPTRKGR